MSLVTRVGFDVCRIRRTPFCFVLYYELLSFFFYAFFSLSLSNSSKLCTLLKKNAFRLTSDTRWTKRSCILSRPKGISSHIYTYIIPAAHCCRCCFLCHFFFLKLLKRVGLILPHYPGVLSRSQAQGKKKQLLSIRLHLRWRFFF